MSNVKAFPGQHVPGTPRESLIEALESALDKARSGELVYFAGTGRLSNGGQYLIRSIQGESLSDVVGGIEMLKYNIIKEK